MKRHFLTGLKAFAVSALALAAVSCYDDSELWGELDKHAGEIADLEERVTALETKLNSEVATLNSTISALEGKMTAADKALEEKLNKSLTDLAERLDAEDAEIAEDIKAILAEVKALKEAFGSVDLSTYEAVLEALQKKDADLDKAMSEKAAALEKALTDLQTKLGGELDDLSDELLAALAEALEGVAVQSVEEKDGTVVLTLANGKTLTLATPDSNANNTGLVTIVDGEWHVVLEDGTTKALDVPVGVEDIEFQVNYDTMELEFSVNGEDFYGTGAYVAGEYDSLVTGYVDRWMETDYVTIYIGENEYHLPKVSDATATILAGKTYFTAEEEKVIPISVDGVKSAFVASVPEGWKASVDVKELELTVKAPEAGQGDTEGMVEVWLLTDDGIVLNATVSVAIGTPVVKITVDPETNDVELTFAEVDGQTPEVIYGFTLASDFTDEYIEEILTMGSQASYMSGVYTNLDEENPDTAPKQTSVSGNMSDFVTRNLDYSAEYVVWAYCPIYDEEWTVTNTADDFYKVYHKMNALIFSSTSSVSDVEFELELLDPKATGFYGFYAQPQYWDMIKKGYLDFEGLISGMFGAEMPCRLYEETGYSGSLKEFGLADAYLEENMCNTVVPASTSIIGIIPYVDGKDTYTIDDVVVYELKTIDVTSGGDMEFEVKLNKNDHQSFTLDVTAEDAEWIFYYVYGPDDEVAADDEAVIKAIAKGEFYTVDDFYYGAYEGKTEVTHTYSWGEIAGTQYDVVFAFVDKDGKATITRGQYSTLSYEAALKAAIENAEPGATITLDNDVLLATSLPIDKELTINFNRKKIVSTATVFYVKPGGNLTVNNGNVTTAGNVFYNNGTLTINGGTYKTTGDLAACVYCDGPVVDGNSTDYAWNLTINGGTFVSEKQTALSLQNNYYGLNPAGSAIINAGTFTGATVGAAYDLYVGCAKITANLSECTFTNDRIYTVAIPECSAWINEYESTQTGFFILNPSGKQFTFYSEDYGMNRIYDLNLTTSGILYGGIDYDEMVEVYQYPEEYIDPSLTGKIQGQEKYENVVVTPTGATSGKITASTTMIPWYSDEPVTMNYLILYSGYDGKTIKFYSPSQFSGEYEAYSGIGLCEFDKSYNPIPLKLSVVTEPKSVVFQDNGGIAL